MGFIRPICDADGADMGPHLGERSVLGDTLCAKGLDGSVDDGEGHVWDEDFGLGDLDEGGFCVGGVDGGRGVEDDEACGINVDSGLCDPLENHALFGEEFTKWLFVRCVGTCEEPLKSFFGLEEG